MGLYKGLVTIDDSDESIHSSQLQAFKSGLSTSVASGSLTRLASASTGTESVTTVGFLPAVVYFIGYCDAFKGSFSNGWTDGTTHACSAFQAGSGTGDIGNCVNIKREVTGNGWYGHAALTSSGFDFHWTKSGDGQDVTVSYLAIK